MAKIKNFQTEGAVQGVSFSFRSRGADWLGWVITNDDASQIWIRSAEESTTAYMAVEVPPNSIVTEDELLEVVSRSDVAIVIDTIIADECIENDFDEDLEDNGSFQVETGRDGALFSVNLNFR